MTSSHYDEARREILVLLAAISDATDEILRLLNDMNAAVMQNNNQKEDKDTDA